MKCDCPVITSRQNPMIMEAASLATRKGRQASGLFMVEGEKLVYEAAKAGLPVVRVIVSEERSDELLPKLRTAYAAPCYAETELRVVSPACFSKISTEKSPQGVIALIKHLDFFKRLTIIYDEEMHNLQNKRVILLSSMQDPGNLGTVIRSAVAFGADTVIMSADCADVYNPKTLRAAMGCLFRINVLVVEDMTSAVRALRACGRRVLAAELRDGAVPLDQISLCASDCVMIGNEGHGIPAEISALCDASVYLPISERAESLNAATAAAVFLWELQKV